MLIHILVILTGEQEFLIQVLHITMKLRDGGMMEIIEGLDYIIHG